VNDLLRKRIKEYAIPAFPAQMTFDNIAIWRLKNPKVSPGGIVLPDVVDEDVENRGVLVSAGPKALDELYSTGIELGQILWFGRFTGDEKQIVKRGSGQAEGQYMLLCKARDVIAGEDLRTAIDAGKIKIVMNADGEHAIEDVPTAKRRHAPKEVTDAATGNHH